MLTFIIAVVIDAISIFGVWVFWNEGLVEAVTFANPIDPLQAIFIYLLSHVLFLGYSR